MTENLIKNQAFQGGMSQIAIRLEQKIEALLDEAASLVPQKGKEARLYATRGEAYTILNDGIFHYWKSKYSNGDPVTDWKQMSKGDFLSWLDTQPLSVREQVYQNLRTYINTPTPKERGIEEFPPSPYPFGY